MRRPNICYFVANLRFVAIYMFVFISLLFILSLFACSLFSPDLLYVFVANLANRWTYRLRKNKLLWFRAHFAICRGLIITNACIDIIQSLQLVQIICKCTKHPCTLNWPFAVKVDFNINNSSSLVSSTSVSSHLNMRNSANNNFSTFVIPLNLVDKGGCYTAIHVKSLL